MVCRNIYDHKLNPAGIKESRLSFIAEALNTNLEESRNLVRRSLDHKFTGIKESSSAQSIRFFVIAALRKS